MWPSKIRFTSINRATQFTLLISQRFIASEEWNKILQRLTFCFLSSVYPVVLFVASFLLQHPLFSPTQSVLFFAHCRPSRESVQDAVTPVWDWKSGDTWKHFFSKLRSRVTVSIVKKTDVLRACRCCTWWCHCLEALWSGELQGAQRKAITIQLFFLSLIFNQLLLCPMTRPFQKPLESSWQSPHR